MAMIKHKLMRNKNELVWNCTGDVGQTLSTRPLMQIPRPAKSEGRAIRAGKILPLPRQLADIQLIWPLPENKADDR